MTNVSTLLCRAACMLILGVACCSEAWAAKANPGQCICLNGTAARVWLSKDAEGKPQVQGSFGFISDMPNAWTSQTISGNAETTQYTKPFLFSSVNGDVAAVWQYLDTNGIFFVEAAILPAGASSWITHTLSPSGQTAGCCDQTAFIDADGNILITWSSCILKTNQKIVLAVTGTIISGIVTLNPAVTITP